MKYFVKYFAPLFCLTLLAFTGCRQPPTPTATLPTTRLTIGRNTYILEIAQTEHDRDKGLMQRDSMPTDRGMIFIFADETERSFWMRNTRIPLDVLYVDSVGRIVSIHRMEPYVESGTKSKGAAKYAIELNAGQAQAAGVLEGQSLQIPADVKGIQAEP